MKRPETEEKINPFMGNIMVHDPSMTAWGYVIIDPKGNVVHMGCIKTESQTKKLRIRAGDDRVRRFMEISTYIYNKIQRHNVSYMLSELPHGSQNASAATMIGAVIGILCTLSATLNIGIEYYSEGDTKKFLFGRGTVEKQEMVQKIRQIYKIELPKEKYKQEAIADAMAVYHLAKQHSPVIKLLTR